MAIELPDNPAREDLLAGRPTLWLNPSRRKGAISDPNAVAKPVQVQESEARWRRFAPLLAARFPELKETGGKIQSPLLEMNSELRHDMHYDGPDFGRLFVKADSELPVAGSIKARGGVFEVLCHAEDLALSEGIISKGGDIMALASDKALALFGSRTVTVGSTGNLGLSVGIAARALGFKAVVHMSSDAKQWKVDRLTRLGVEVVKHQTDFTTAVERAREAADSDPNTYFVDDEMSEFLFFGYTGAGSELAAQLQANGVNVDADHPLFVYLPCGIGGSPGGASFGLKTVYGDNVHCFFVEPAQSACVMAHMMSGITDHIVSAYDVGLTNKTEADGMAVGRMSPFVAEVMRPLLSGIFTIGDDDLFRWLWHAWTDQKIKLEPSAVASFAGPDFLLNSGEGRRYQREEGLTDKMKNATHVMWTTGGSFVPEDQFQGFVARGKELCGAG